MLKQLFYIKIITIFVHIKQINKKDKMKQIKCKTIGYLKFAYNLIEYRKQEISIIKKVIKSLKKSECVNGSEYKKLCFGDKYAIVRRNLKKEVKWYVSYDSDEKNTYWSIYEPELQQELGIEKKIDNPTIEVIIERNHTSITYNFEKAINNLYNWIKHKEIEIYQLKESINLYNSDGTLDVYAKKIIKRYNKDFYDSIEKLKDITIIPEFE